MRQIRYIKLSSLMFNIALICVASYAILENVGISIDNFGNIRRPLLFMAAFCLIPLIGSIIKKLKRKEYFLFCMILFIFLGTFSYSTLINRDTVSGSGVVYATINLFLYIIELFILMIYAAENNKVQSVFNLIFRYALLITIITDVIIFTGIVHFTDGAFETYLIGTKFSVVYLHIYLLAFYLLKYSFGKLLSPRQIVMLIILSFMAICVSIRIDCNTGIIGSMLLVVFVLIFWIYRDKVLKAFSSPLLFLVFIFGSGIIAFLLERIIQTPAITNLITNTLERDLTLTGRTEIFSLYTLKMAGHWLWGYGYGNAYTVSMGLFGYADAQNALLQWILQVGIIPIIFLVLLWANIMHHVSMRKDLIKIMPIIALIYVFIILGTVEITYSMNFFLWMGLLFMWSHQKSYN